MAIGLIVEFRPVATDSYPFAAVDIVTGQQIADAVEWRDIPTGVLPAWHGAVEGRAAIAIPAGEPLRPWVTAEFVLPDNWWAIPLPLPGTVRVGSSIRVVLANSATAEGIVTETGIEDGYEPVSMVAFSESDAALVAHAAANDAFVVMVGSASKVAPPNG